MQVTSSVGLSVNLVLPLSIISFIRLKTQDDLDIFRNTIIGFLAEIEVRTSTPLSGL